MYGLHYPSACCLRAPGDDAERSTRILANSSKLHQPCPAMQVFKLPDDDVHDISVVQSTPRTIQSRNVSYLPQPRITCSRGFTHHWHINDEACLPPFARSTCSPFCSPILTSAPRRSSTSSCTSRSATARVCDAGMGPQDRAPLPGTSGHDKPQLLCVHKGVTR